MEPIAYGHDDDLIESTREDGTTRVRVYRLEETIIVLGRGSDPETELHLDAVRESGVPVLKRRGGGCSVVIDPGNVIVSAAFPLAGLGEIRSTFERATRWLIEGLTRIGFPGVRSDGISDLVVGDRKIAGSCVYRSLGLFFFSASLLVEPDVAAMTRYLRHPPREPDYRRGRSHERFVGRIADLWHPPPMAPRTASPTEALRGALEPVLEERAFEERDRAEGT